jgi:GTPase
MKATGNLAGLKPSQLKNLSNIYRRRLVPFELISSSLAQSLVLFSEEIGREIGVFIDRKGRISEVIVGTSQTLPFPELAWKERGRLSGLRLVHAHPLPSRLRKDDITNLVINRLDLIAVVYRNTPNQPIKIDYANTDTSNSAVRHPPLFLAKLDFNFLTFIKELEIEFGIVEKVRKIYKSNQAVLVVVGKERSAVERRIVELQELANTAGVHVDDIQYQVRPRLDNKTLVGKGKLDDILLTAKKHDADMLIFDPELTPTQARVISSQTDLKVLDRTMLILDIFAQRAITSEGKFQVELAQLKYTLPRLISKDTMMSRLTGGIGGRGPGETKLEINRRRAQSRIELLQKQIGKLSTQRALRRRRRQARRVPTISIVGYTNAGKSTLLKAITGADVLIEDKLFATLDPRTRRVRFPRNVEIIFTDTVGFIEDLPKDLKMAFKATLEELSMSDLIIHLVDISDTDHEYKEKAVEQILDEMSLGNIKRINVYNKIDQLPYLPPLGDNLFYISSKNKDTLRGLIEYVTNYFGKTNDYFQHDYQEEDSSQETDHNVK